MFDSLHSIFDPIEKTLVSWGLGFTEVAVIGIVLAVISSIPWIRIFRRVGYSPGMGLLMCIPLVNIFVFLVFAYHEWPAEREYRTPDESAFWR